MSCGRKEVIHRFLSIGFLKTVRCGTIICVPKSMNITCMSKIFPAILGQNAHVLPPLSAATALKHRSSYLNPVRMPRV